MCGFAGFLDVRRQIAGVTMRATVARMANTLRHRGPDDTGVWVDPTVGIALGHCRLSILDLSAAGHQPMLSGSGRYVIGYNGEIYNAQELRRELNLITQGSLFFRGRSDTEVMLAAIDQWGVWGAVARMNGMFAFALWDRWERILYLGRDRLGEKPVYYGWEGKTFLFGSELKALRCFPEFRSEINRHALALYFRHNCIPSPHSIYERVHKLPPATILAVSIESPESAVPTPYWSLKEVAERGATDPFSGSEADAVQELGTLLMDAVKIRMLADVPLGAFLSGGIDSSTVAALMQAHGERRVKTYTIGSCDPAYNEAADAKAVARHLGTEHTELYVTPAEALAVIPRLPEIYDEPFADSSQIVTFLVAQMARQHVTVCLSGDGGDEVFGGYNRHVWSRAIWKAMQWAPPSARMAAAKAIRCIAPDHWDAFSQSLGKVFPRRLMYGQFGYKLHKLAGILPSSSPQVMYFALVSHWLEPESLVLGAKEPETLLTRPDAWALLPEFVQQMMFFDAATYLPDDILTKVDRATMAVGLEARVPLLDHRVVEFAWRLPSSLKIRDGQGKWILREVLRRYVPPHLTDRTKAGFGIPLDRWLRGPLREWAESLLDEHRLREEGFLSVQPIREMWNAFIDEKHAWQYHLWDVLMFQAWRSEQHESGPQLESTVGAASDGLCSRVMNEESFAPRDSLDEFPAAPR